MNTLQSISKIIDRSICDGEETYNAFKQRLEAGIPTRDENPKTHFCVYFLPYDSQGKKIFIVHHKKSGLWLSPGGHINKGEILHEALSREVSEELGVKNDFRETQPFLLTITQIENKVQLCKVHYDIWYLFPTNGSNFNIDPTEFHDIKWLTVEEARKIVTDPCNLKALEVVQKLIENQNLARS
ncbi:MAG TPA: NUDIX domain-containing protein [Candidatus Humimicrobiaceae bacterium]|nr:NUDIX domain-containing protein [Candidatus Humimicrobiaceae bacterium]